MDVPHMPLPSTCHVGKFDSVQVKVMSSSQTAMNRCNGISQRLKVILSTSTSCVCVDGDRSIWCLAQLLLTICPLFLFSAFLLLWSCDLTPPNRASLLTIVVLTYCVSHGLTSTCWTELNPLNPHRNVPWNVRSALCAAYMLDSLQFSTHVLHRYVWWTCALNVMFLLLALQFNIVCVFWPYKVFIKQPSSQHTNDKIQ